MSFNFANTLLKNFVIKMLQWIQSSIIERNTTWHRNKKQNILIEQVSLFSFVEINQHFPTEIIWKSNLFQNKTFTIKSIILKINQSSLKIIFVFVNYSISLDRSLNHFYEEGVYWGRSLEWLALVHWTSFVPPTVKTLTVTRSSSPGCRTNHSAGVTTQAEEYSVPGI